MNKINLLFCLVMVFLMFYCVDPGDNPNNPDLRIMNDLENYKISDVRFNNQLFTSINEYLIPGEQTEYMKVEAGSNVLLSYRWEHVGNSSDSGETGTMFTEGEFEGFQENRLYTISITGDKNLPDLYVYQP